MAQTAGTFISNKTEWMVSFSCLRDALADSLSRIVKKENQLDGWELNILEKPCMSNPKL